ncbi:MAG: aspartyl/asparaginyl beta-hydroxylase domain-containing protein [Steroidobacteraceae bacterium]|nr:aspartyl/asparaginyl beta-hydroxylase domain-containing protein [Steroidobacteraceae bacterium]
MLDLPGIPELDKRTLVGACARLRLHVDAERLKAEVAALPRDVWGSTGGRVGVHSAAEAVFLRGYAPAEGARPIADRELLAQLPYVREIIYEQIPAQPLRCLLAKLPAGAAIPPHIDRAPYFAKSLRLHMPVETHEQAWMVCAGWCYLMHAGEVWVLNNCAEHAVWNAHPMLPRTHLICDFLPSDALLGMVAEADRHLGVERPDVSAHVRAAANPSKHAGASV